MPSNRSNKTGKWHKHEDQHDDDHHHAHVHGDEHDDDNYNDNNVVIITINRSMSSSTTSISSGKRTGGGGSGGGGGGITMPQVNPNWARLPLFDRKGWKRMTFGQFADSVNERVEPADAAEEIYVGLDDLDSGSLHIRRWGKGSDVIGTKLRFRKGDIIFGRRRAYQRKLAVAEFDGICSAHAMVVRAKPVAVLPEFLPFLMMSDRFMKRAVEISVGSLSPTINWTTLKLEEFDLPPLDQQRRVAEILWTVDECENCYEKLKLNLTQYERAYLADALGSLVKANQSARLGDVSAFVTSGSRGWAEFYSESGALFIRSQNIRNQVLDFTDLQRVQAPDGAEGNRTQTRPGDLLITATGNSVGNVAFVPEDLEKAYVSQHVALVRLKNPEMHRMLAAFFGPVGPGNEQIKKAQYGLKPGLNLIDIKNFLIPLPSDNDLSSITQKINQLDEAKIQHEHHAANSTQLKQQLINSLICPP